MALDLQKVTQAIGKTGFKLEFETGNILRLNGWHLISNRCYIDDLEGTVREIDLLAYKVNIVEGISVYTVIIVSCKKSEANAWALLSRPIEQNDPNANWRPFKGWSNHPAIDYYLSKMTWAAAYHEKLSNICPSLFSPPSVDVFAFQEISKANHTCQNDKNIFSSITSLMKAQAYEMSILDKRQANTKRYYQFNLVSVIDSEIARVYFNGDSIETSSIKSEDYLCRYILNEREEVARIKFVTAEAFSGALEEYSTLHQGNCKIVAEHYQDFYADAYKQGPKARMLLGDFNKLVKPAIISSLLRNRRSLDGFGDVSLFWFGSRNLLQIEIDYKFSDFETLELLNSDKQLSKRLETILADVYQYHGDFEIDEHIPF